MSATNNCSSGSSEGSMEEEAVLVAKPKRTLTVYRCRNCSSLLGNDDFLAPGAHFDTKNILLLEVENAMMSTSLKISADSEDKGCTYHILQCKRCQEDVGVHYSSVTKALQYLDKTYRLRLACIESVPMSVTTMDTHAEINDLKEKVNDLAVMLVTATMDRCHMKDSILTLAELIGSLKAQVDQGQGDASTTLDEEEEEADTGVYSSS